MKKIIYSDKRMEVHRFVNFYGDRMFSIRFKVDEGSADNYHGWKIKKADKIAGTLRKIARRLERI